MSRHQKKSKRTPKKNPSTWASIVALSKVLVPRNTGVYRHVATAY